MRIRTTLAAALLLLAGCARDGNEGSRNRPADSAGSVPAAQQDNRGATTGTGGAAGVTGNSAYNGGGTSPTGTAGAPGRETGVTGTGSTGTKDRKMPASDTGVHGTVQPKRQDTGLPDGPGAPAPGSRDNGTQGQNTGSRGTAGGVATDSGPRK